MFSSELLPIYLNDHFALSTAGRDLARRTAGQNEGTELEPFLKDLAEQIEADRRQLEQVMDLLEVKRDPVKTGVTWLGEKLGRFKLNGRLLSYSPLSRVIELEGLMAGVRAKMALWHVLAAASTTHERLTQFDFAQLVARAEGQIAGLTAAHAQAVQAMLAEDAAAGRS